MTTLTLNAPICAPAEKPEKTGLSIYQQAWAIAGGIGHKAAALVPESITSTYWLLQPIVKDAVSQNSRATNGVIAALQSGPGY